MTGARSHVDDAIIALEMMAVKLEAGWDQMKAASFSYSSTAIPRLTGALITVAAFMPIGFSKSTSGECAGGIFWIVGIAVLFSWGLFTPYLALKMLPKDFGKHRSGARMTRRRCHQSVARAWVLCTCPIGCAAARANSETQQLTSGTVTM